MKPQDPSPLDLDHMEEDGAACRDEPSLRGTSITADNLTALRALIAAVDKDTLDNAELPWAVCDEPKNDYWYKDATVYSVGSCGPGVRVADVCTVGRFLPKARQVADLIVGAVNALPELIDLAQEALGNRKDGSSKQDLDLVEMERDAEKLESDNAAEFRIEATSETDWRVHYNGDVSRRIRRTVSRLKEAQGSLDRVNEWAKAELATVHAEHATALQASEARAHALEAERDEAEKDVHELTKALTGVTGGGSENFIQKRGRYIADIPHCLRRIQERADMQHRLVVEAVSARKAEQARSHALEGALRTAVGLLEIWRAWTPGYCTAHTDFESLPEIQQARALLSTGGVVDEGSAIRLATEDDLAQIEDGYFGPPTEDDFGEDGPAEQQPLATSGKSET